MVDPWLKGPEAENMPTYAHTVHIHTKVTLTHTQYTLTKITQYTLAQKSHTHSTPLPKNHIHKYTLAQKSHSMPSHKNHTIHKNHTHTQIHNLHKSHTHIHTMHTHTKITLRHTLFSPRA